MLTRLYVDTLLVDEDLADMVWEVWDAGLIPDESAAWAWCMVAAPAPIKYSRNFAAHSSTPSEKLIPSNEDTSISPHLTVAVPLLIGRSSFVVNRLRIFESQVTLQR